MLVAVPRVVEVLEDLGCAGHFHHRVRPDPAELFRRRPHPAQLAGFFPAAIDFLTCGGSARRRRQLGRVEKRPWWAREDFSFHRLEYERQFGAAPRRPRVARQLAHPELLGPFVREVVNLPPPLRVSTVPHPPMPPVCPVSSRVPFVATRSPLSRRRFLRGTGIALALPFLESMRPVFARGSTVSSPLAPGAKPRRMFAICNNLGLLGDQFFPAHPGRDYAPSPYLQLLQEHQRDFSVFSGVSHPNVDGGHPADVCFLTAAPHPGSSSFRNTISLDQFVAEQVGTLTRFPSLTLGVNTRSRSLSWTGTGVAIPPEDKAADVFKQLFLQGSPAQIATQLRQLDTGRSILDTVADQARELQRHATARDRDRLDQYFTSVRNLERRLQASRGWEQKPKPVVHAPVPIDPTNPAAYMAKVKVMYDLARLALETDSTRAITLMLDGVSTPVLELDNATLTDGYHNLSHHGKSERKRGELKLIDEWHMKLFAQLMADLKAVREDDESLLDRTMVLYGSNFGDANAHTCFNLPTLLAGGGFKHGQHLAFSRTNNYPLPNLFVSMLQRMGIEADKFASATGTMRGLDLA